MTHKQLILNGASHLKNIRKIQLKLLILQKIIRFKTMLFVGLSSQDLAPLGADGPR